jgi:hypothetical protein
VSSVGTSPRIQAVTRDLHLHQKRRESRGDHGHSDDSEFVVSNQSDINITGRAGMRATAAYGLSSPEESHP